MNSSVVINGSLKLNLVSLSYALGLVLASFFIWSSSLDRQPTSLGAGLRVAALGLVVMWTHFLVCLIRRILSREVSNGYCAVLFFGAWATFFLVYNCLI
jgi:hypothetical protein